MRIMCSCTEAIKLTGDGLLAEAFLGKLPPRLNCSLLTKRKRLFLLLLKG